MRVQLLSQHFAPEITAGRFRVEAFVDELIARGHEVDVICAVPNHPQGVIQPGYRGRLQVRRAVRGADVRYVWVHVRPRKTLGTRLGFYGSYAALAVAAGAAAARPDVILASSPPLPVGAAGAVLAMRHRAPWVLDVRDVWPDAAVELGELSNESVISAAASLERALYRRARAIVTVNEAFGELIEERAPAEARVEVIPNGTTRSWLAAGDAPPDRTVLGTDDYVWCYAGNIGLAHGLETAVEAANLLGPGYRLLIIGDGPRRTEIARLAADGSPGSVEIRPLVTPAEAAVVLRAADLLLVSETQERTVASKLYDYGAVGRPVVAACRGELRRVIDEAGIGVSVPPGDAGTLADAIRSLRSDSARAEDLAARGRRFAAEHLREAQASRLADLLEDTAGSS